MCLIWCRSKYKPGSSELKWVFIRRLLGLGRVLHSTILELNVWTWMVTTSTHNQALKWVSYLPVCHEQHTALPCFCTGKWQLRNANWQHVKNTTLNPPHEKKKFKFLAKELLSAFTSPSQCSCWSFFGPQYQHKWSDLWRVLLLGMECISQTKCQHLRQGNHHTEHDLSWITILRPVIWFLMV